MAILSSNPLWVRALRGLTLGTTLCVVTGASLVWPTTACAAPTQAAVETAQPTDPAALALHREGHAALAAGNAARALERFRELESLQRQQGQTDVDTALYWQAYALDAAGRQAQAARTAQRLLREFPGSRWQAEAHKFVAREPAPAGPAQATQPAQQREADALMALDALMAGGSQRALPTLERVLGSDHSVNVKLRALFVLTQLDAAAAGKALRRILDDPASPPRLRREAVQQIAIGGNNESLEHLVALYPGADPSLRQAIVQAYMVAGRSDLLLQVARNEPDPGLKRQAIQLLGAQGETAALGELYQANDAPEVRSAVVQAMGISGDVQGLSRILREARDAHTQRAALHALAIAGDQGSAAVIIATYRQAEDDSVRNAAMHALLVAGDVDALVTLYRETTDRERRRVLLQTISSADPDRVIELIDAQL